MQDRRELERAKIDGRAAFAGVGYLMGVGLIFLLGRVGAPDGLVRTLGPLLALFAVGLVGVLTRSTRAPAFFVADRAIPEPYAGLAFAAIAAGLIICLGPAGDAPLPPAGVAIGLAISALVVGPFLRACGASAPSDLLATRFPNPLVRIATTALLLAIGVFTAAAGFAATVDTLVWLFSLSRGGAVAIVAGVLVLAVAPGGIASLLWSAAGGAGILVIVLALPIFARFFQDGAAIGEAVRETGFWSDAFARGWSSAGVSDPGLSLLVVLASAIAVAALAPFASPAIATSSERQALRAGAMGLILIAFLVFAALLDLAIRPIRPDAMTSGLRAGALLLGPLALCAAGVHAASRARGANAGAPYGRHMPLASQRLARSRALLLAVIALCVGLAYRLPFSPKAAVMAAALLSLSLIAPVLALAFSARATSGHAIACLVVNLACAAAFVFAERQIPSAARLLVGALCVGAAGFVVGWGAAIFSRGNAEAAPLRRDMFIDAPLDPAG